MNEGTSAYWRNLLEIEKPVPPGFLEQYQTPHRFLRPFFYWLVSAPFKYYCPLEVRGLENLPAKAPYIIAANHGSSMDYVCVAWAMGKRKKELYPLTTKLFYDNPWARFWIKVAANAVRIDTVEEFFPALRVAVKVLKAGKAVYVNPEGMRTLDGNLLPFRPGVGALAVEAGVPMVPVYLHNTWKALPTGWIFPRPFPVAVSFGKPIAPEVYREKLRTVQAYDVYKEVTEELRQRIIGLSRSPC
jgi:1-acyl-sn-glycerol-3-phosphate acyltransferase